MARISLCLIVVTTIALASTANMASDQASRRQADSFDPYESYLAQVGLSVEEAELIRFLKVCAANDKAFHGMSHLVRDLDDNHFQTREKATQALVAIGPAVIPKLKEEVRNRQAGLEFARRAQDCICKIEELVSSGRAPPQYYGSCRLLAISAMFRRESSASADALFDGLLSPDVEVHGLCAGIIQYAWFHPNEAYGTGPLRPGVPLAKYRHLVGPLMSRLRSEANGKDDALRQMAENASERLGREILRRKMASVASRHDVERRSAELQELTRLPFLAFMAHDACPFLARQLKDDNVQVRRLAAVGLGEMALESPTAVPALAIALGDVDEAVRLGALRSLAKVGDAASSAYPEVAKLAKSTSGQLREEALCTLGVIAPPEAEALPILLDALKDPQCRNSAIAGIGSLGDRAKSAVPILRRILEDQLEQASLNNETCRLVVAALGKIGPGAGSAVDPLVEIVEKNYGLRTEAMHALGGIGQASARVVPILVRLIDQKRHNQTTDLNMAVAIELLNKLGPAAKPAVPQLLRLVRERNDIAACRAIISIDPSLGKEAKELLLQQIKGKHRRAMEKN